MDIADQATAAANMSEARHPLAIGLNEKVLSKQLDMNLLL